MPTLFQKPQLSRINARHLLDDLAGGYSYGLEEAVLVELVANALDSGATRVAFWADERKKTLTIEDNGQGMGQEEFHRYHDLAESRKEKGKGIGFAGLGAKLAHKLADKVITETRSAGYHAASEWYWKEDDLEWRLVRSGVLKGQGTKVSLTIAGKHSLVPSFIEDVLFRHYGALLDLDLSRFYVWEAIYPEGIELEINGVPLELRPLVPSEKVEKRAYRDILDRKKRIGRALFVYAQQPLPEAQQGIAIVTYGKSIQRDFFALHPQDPERITGWVEVPQLVKCLTLNKQGFVDSGPSGDLYRKTRRVLQKAFSEWLADIGQNVEREAAHRAPRALERETAQIIRRIPELRYLFRASAHDSVALPDAHGEEGAALTDGTQLTGGVGTGHGGENGVPPAPGPDEGEVLLISPDGHIRARSRRRQFRVGPSIRFVSRAIREDMSWLDGDILYVNTAHPTYVKAQREHQLTYHQRFAVLLTLCREAGATSMERFELLARALTQWGRN